jgi:hypothetical protein
MTIHLEYTSYVMNDIVAASRCRTETDVEAVVSALVAIEGSAFTIHKVRIMEAQIINMAKLVHEKSDQDHIATIQFIYNCIYNGLLGRTGDCCGDIINIFDDEDSEVMYIDATTVSKKSDDTFTVALPNMISVGHIMESGINIHQYTMYPDNQYAIEDDAAIDDNSYTDILTNIIDGLNSDWIRSGTTYSTFDRLYDAFQLYDGLYQHPKQGGFGAPNHVGGFPNGMRYGPHGCANNIFGQMHTNNPQDMHHNHAAHGSSDKPTTPSEHPASSPDFEIVDNVDVKSTNAIPLGDETNT